ncbi:MAG: Phenylalanine--tRNA ligase beta subunit [Chlamydiae bacterium]|nr:Phenylalanine--tRNA ligase beta subunit [Chlamydiota bacterium]
MQFSLKWLQDFFKSPLSSNQLEERLTSAGLEVDAITEKKAPFEGVVVALVKETRPHPDADRLCIATVFDGKQNLQVVCGAKNCREGLITALAPIGSILIDKSGKKHKMKLGVLRGVESNGMLLSPEELGFDEKSEGIIELTGEFEIGSSLKALFEDEILEISFTPNLGHAMSHLGIARETACHFELPYQVKELAPIKASNFKTDDHFKVKINDNEHCPIYGCRLIKNIKIGPSPVWLKSRLEACGLKSINNVVDATNYILHEIGQPLHAFDADLIAGSQINIEQSKKELTIETLDGVERKIPKGTLLISDIEKPIALAGIIGGANSQVSEKTTHILLEAAHFTPRLIRKVSKNIGLYTEASKHFERGVDPSMVSTALDRATALILESSSGDASVENYITAFDPIVEKVLSCRCSQINKLLGTQISTEEITKIFKRLEFTINKVNEDLIELKVPTYRNDINLEVDLIEEVARVYGLDKIHTQSAPYSFSELEDGPHYQLEQKLHPLLQQAGLQEVITCDLISPEMNQLQENSDKCIAALNYMSKEQSILRTSLLSNHLQILKHNQDHQNLNIHVYEMGKTYLKKGDCFEEEEKLALTLTGRNTPYHWTAKDDKLDFFHLKGIIENLLAPLHTSSIQYSKSDLNTFHPGIQAQITIDNVVIGSFGEIHPSILRKVGLKQPVFFAEILLSPLIPISLKPLELKPIAQFPASERDWTFTCLDELEIGHLIQAITSISSRLLKDVFLLDLYQSEKIGVDKKNVTLRFVYRNDKKTISFEAVEIEHARITSDVQEKMKNLIIQPS